MGMTLRSFNRIVAATAAAAVMAGCGINNGTGNYVGVVSRIQTDGVLDMCKTWEGEIAALSIRGARAGSGSTMRFTAKDPQIAAQLEEAMNKQTPVRIEFRDVVNPWKCTQESNDIVTKVEKMDVPLNSPFGGKLSATPANDSEEAPHQVFAATSGKKVLMCTEVDAASVSVAAPVAAPAPEAKVTAPAKPAPQLPEVLRLHK